MSAPRRSRYNDGGDQKRNREQKRVCGSDQAACGRHLHVLRPIVVESLDIAGPHDDVGHDYRAHDGRHNLVCVNRQRLADVQGAKLIPAPRPQLRDRGCGR